MNTHAKAVAVSSLLALSLVAGGCSISVNEGYSDGARSSTISESRMGELVASNRGLSLGMSKGEALGLFPVEYATLKSSSKVDGHVVEEWRVQAYNKSKRVLFRRWLYFVDGELVEFGDGRLGFSAESGLPAHWQD